MASSTSPSVSSLELTADDEGRVACILCRGALESHTAGRLRSAIDAALRRPRILLCLDLQEITYVDSAGIGLVAETIERCAAERVHLELWPGAAVERMLREIGVPAPLRAYPARPSQLFAESEWA